MPESERPVVTKVFFGRSCMQLRVDCDHSGRLRTVLLKHVLLTIMGVSGASHQEDLRCPTKKHPTPQPQNYSHAYD